MPLVITIKYYNIVFIDSQEDGAMATITLHTLSITDVSLRLCGRCKSSILFISAIHFTADWFVVQLEQDLLKMMSEKEKRRTKRSKQCEDADWLMDEKVKNRTKRSKHCEDPDWLMSNDVADDPCSNKLISFCHGGRKVS